MNTKRLIITLFVILVTYSITTCQEKVLYKKVDSNELYMEVHKPESMDSAIKYPAMVFFFGGGWNGGSINQFKPHTKHFTQRGMVCFLVDYRVKSRQNSTPFESLMDAKSAIRYIREHAETFGIDPSKIVASGGSAGGHLAAATALITEYNESSDNLSTSHIPNALVLYNPVIDNGPGGYGYERVGDEYKDFSPIHNIKNGAPPTILFLGSKDPLIPVETVEYYKTVMEKVGSRCDLHIYQGQAHGFFNYKNFEFYKKTVTEADKFLQSTNYIQSTPIVEIIEQ